MVTIIVRRIRWTQLVREDLEPAASASAGGMRAPPLPAEVRFYSLTAV